MGQRGLADLLGAGLEPGTWRASEELVCLSERLVWSSVETRMESDSEVKEAKIHTLSMPKQKC